MKYWVKVKVWATSSEMIRALTSEGGGELGGASLVSLATSHSSVKDRLDAEEEEAWTGGEICLSKTSPPFFARYQTGCIGRMAS